MNRFDSDPLEVHHDSDGLSQLYRADLIFYGVDHSGPSYEGRVFLNNSEAGFDTPPSVEERYAGSFYVFGHGGCVGEEGHCEPDDRYEDAFDRRAPHPIRPWTKTVTVTEALRRVEDEEVTVTVIPVEMGPVGGAETEALTVEAVRLAIYLDDPAN